MKGVSGVLYKSTPVLLIGADVVAMVANPVGSVSGLLFGLTAFPFTASVPSFISLPLIVEVGMVAGTSVPLMSVSFCSLLIVPIGGVAVLSN